eukprot:1572365-Rhodomonas_salina.2
MQPFQQLRRSLLDLRQIGATERGDIAGVAAEMAPCVGFPPPRRYAGTPVIPPCSSSVPDTPPQTSRETAQRQNSTEHHTSRPTARHDHCTPHISSLDGYQHAQYCTHRIWARYTPHHTPRQIAARTRATAQLTGCPP